MLRSSRRSDRSKDCDAPSTRLATFAHSPAWAFASSPRPLSDSAEKSRPRRSITQKGQSSSVKRDGRSLKQCQNKRFLEVRATCAAAFAHEKRVYPTGFIHTNRA